MILPRVSRVWATNLGSPVVPEVVSSKAGAPVSVTAGKDPPTTSVKSLVQGCTRRSVTPPSTRKRALTGRFIGSVAGDLGIEIGLADIEGGPQATQQGIQLGGFQAGIQRRGDGPDSKAGVIGDRELGPVPQMQSDAITPSQPPRDQAAREAVDLGGEARIAPDIIAHDEGGALGAGFGLVTQSSDGSHT